MKKILRHACLLPAILVAAPATGQGNSDTSAPYPARPIRMIVPFTGGSTLDIMARRVAEWMKALAGVDVVHVPYKGSGPALTDVIGRQVDMTFISTVARCSRSSRMAVYALWR